MASQQEYFLRKGRNESQSNGNSQSNNSSPIKMTITLPGSNQKTSTLPQLPPCSSLKPILSVGDDSFSKIHVRNRDRIVSEDYLNENDLLSIDGRDVHKEAEMLSENDNSIEDQYCLKTEDRPRNQKNYKSNQSSNSQYHLKGHPHKIDKIYLQNMRTQRKLLNELQLMHTRIESLEVNFNAKDITVTEALRKLQLREKSASLAVKESQNARLQILNEIGMLNHEKSFIESNSFQFITGLIIAVLLLLVIRA